MPEYQVVTRIALSFAAFSVPKVATASCRSGITPPSSSANSPRLIRS
nr:hypothetical protein [Pseudonocardia sp. AL041005-10]